MRLKYWMSVEDDGQNEYSSGSTCHRRFQEWTVHKVFQTKIMD